MPEQSYFLRITPYEQLSFEDIIEVVETLGIKKYFICYEEASRPHYHLCLFSERGVENLRYQIKKRINGQIYLSGRQIDNKLRAIAYCMKDGVWREKGINILDIMAAKALSKPKENFDDDIAKLVAEPELSIEQITSRIVDTYVKYNRKVYRHHIRALVELIRIKRCPEYRKNLIRNIIDDY